MTMSVVFVLTWAIALSIVSTVTPVVKQLLVMLPNRISSSVSCDAFQPSTRSATRSTHAAMFAGYDIDVRCGIPHKTDTAVFFFTLC